MRHIPPPDVHELLIPVIACLPTAFISPRPPPALLPYLSPILRQRLSLLSATPSTANRGPGSDSAWLHLLTWSPANARRLNDVVSNLQLEPHPVSGEIELFEEDLDGEQGRIKYRRLDAETLQAKCNVVQHRLSVIWVWCTNDTGGVGLENASSGEAKDGWRVAEVRACDDDTGADTDSGWYDTMTEADEAAASKSGFIDPAAGELEDRVVGNGAQIQDDIEDEDDYWAAYDQTPSTRTPAKQSPAPPALQSRVTPGGNRSSAEADYFARYGSEVQPAMDGHDPDEAEAASGQESSFNRQEALPQQEIPINGSSAVTLPAYRDHASSAEARAVETMNATVAAQGLGHIESPTPSRPESPVEVSPVARLEASAASASVAEIAVKQHISTEMKSLYRLARTAGIDQTEFERVVKTELEVLGMMDL